MNKQLLESLLATQEYELDNYGQIVFYSGWYEHSDGSIHEQEEINA